MKSDTIDAQFLENSQLVKLDYEELLDYGGQPLVVNANAIIGDRGYRMARIKGVHGPRTLDLIVFADSE